jgi:hypothetical protein
MNLTSKQDQVLKGLLLGDGCLFMGKSNKSPLLSVGRAAKDKSYLEFQADIFSNLCSDEGIIPSNKFDKKRNKTYLGFKFRTRSLEVLLPYYKLWYPEGKKIVPSNLELTPTTVAHWFCDDGSIHPKKDRDAKKYQALILKLSANSFIKNDVEFLHSLLTKRYGNFFHIEKDSLEWYRKKNPLYVEGQNNYFILTYTEGAWNIYDDIKSVFPLGMDRKLNLWKDAGRPDDFNESTAKISERKLNEIMQFIDNHSVFTAIDVANSIDWFMDTAKYGKVPNSAIRKHLNNLVKENFLTKEKAKSNKGYQYRKV